MAKDEGNFRDILNLGSEEWVEYTCTLCDKQGKHVAAIKHCVKCAENLCKVCLSYHEKYTRGHQILDKLSSHTGQKRHNLPVQKCEKHEMKLVDVYCPTHNIVGCTTCVKLDHRFCKGIQYIPYAVLGTETSKAVADLESKLNRVSARLDHIQLQTKEQLQVLQKRKDKLIKEIKDLRKKINLKLDRMEKTLLNDVDSLCDMKTTFVTQKVETVKKMKVSIEQRLRDLMDAKKVNDSEIFVQLKMGMINLKETECTIKEAENDEIVRPMAILPNKDIMRFFAHADKTFGRISEDFGFKFTTHYGDYSVRLQSDSFTCQITDARLTTSGQVIMTDFKNKRLKKMCHSYAVTEHLDLSDFPACICEVDDTQLAVTLGNERKVQFVSQQPLALGKSFSVSDRCRGIYCYDGQLFVCCGGYTEKHEGLGHIDVFNLNGILLRTHYEGLNRPAYIMISENDKLFVSEDKQNNLVTVDMNGDHVSKIQSKHLSQPRGGSLLGDNQLCITGEMSNNIVLLSNDGEQQQEVLTEKDGLVRPRVVVFDEKQSRLLICLHTSDIIKVFCCRH